MGTTVTKTTFKSDLGRDGGSINVASMSTDLQKAIKASGANEAEVKKELATIAGSDGIIRGQSELGALFKYVDSFDKNGSASSIATSKDGVDTTSGKLYAALKGDADGSRAAASKKGALRFAGDTRLEAVASGSQVLKVGSKGSSVRKVQETLLDMGYKIPGGASGTFDAKTAHAVKQFQRDVGLEADGKVGKDTLGALKQTAPAPGKRLERSAEYDKLYKDGRLDMTVAIGYDEGGAHQAKALEVVNGLKKDGYKPLDVSKLDAKEKTRLGLTPDRYDPNAQYFHKTFKDPKTGKDVDAVVRMIEPGTDGKAARDSFKQGLEQDEVVIYAGHARYGTGPDFDDKKSGDGNFVVDEKGNRHHEKPPAALKKALKGRKTDLDQLKGRPDYQLVIMNGCSTEEYLKNLRDPETFKGRNDTNTDLITTSQPTWVATGGDHVLAFMRGVTSRQNNSDMLSAHDQIELDYSKKIGETSGEQCFGSNGFLNNAENREVP